MIMKLNFKNLTACVAIAFGTIASGNAMNQNVIQEHEMARLDYTMARLVSDQYAYNNANDALIRENAERLVKESRGMNADRILSFKIDEHLARRRCAQILKRIHRAAGLYDLEGVNEVGHEAMMDVIPAGAYHPDSFTKMYGSYLLASFVLYGYYTPRRYDEQIRNFNNDHIDGLAKMYALTVATERGVAEDMQVIKAAYNSALMRLTEIGAYGFVKLAYALENGRDINREINSVKYELWQKFAVRDLRLAFDYGFFNNRMFISARFNHNNIDAKIKRSRRIDLTLGTPHSNAIKSFCERNGGLQGAINAVHDACRRNGK